MKIQTYFYIFIVAICMAISGYVSSKYTAKKYELYYQEELAELDSLHTQQTIELNTKIIKGEANHKKQVSELVDFYQKKVAKLNYDIANMYQKPDEDIIDWDEFVDFVPDPLPDVQTIIKEVIVNADIVDYANYSYSDANSGYSVDINVKYDSNVRSFFFTPENIHFEPVKEKTLVTDKKKATFCIMWLGNENGFGLVQYDLLPFLVVGGGVGIVEKEFSPGIIVGLRF